MWDADREGAIRATVTIRDDASPVLMRSIVSVAPNSARLQPFAFLFLSDCALTHMEKNR